MKKLIDLESEINLIFNDLKEEDIHEYAYLKYPKFLPMLKMKVKKYQLDGFGSLMSMNTSMMGLMKLSTFSFTPNSGISAPYLLIDTMSMGKKRLAYVEFYDCREKKDAIPSLNSLKKDYQNIPDYNEKPAWYIKERMEGSLIKSSSNKEEESLVFMVLDALKRYQKVIYQANSNIDNLKGLEAFAERMVNEGNPSSSTLNKVLGEEKAKEFFHQIIMPLK